MNLPGLGPTAVVVRWLRPPNQDWALVEIAGRLSDERAEALRLYTRRHAVLDVRTGLYYWSRDTLNRLAYARRYHPSRRRRPRPRIP